MFIWLPFLVYPSTRLKDENWSAWSGPGVIYTCKKWGNKAPNHRVFMTGFLSQVAKEEGARKTGKESSDIEDDLRLLNSFSKIPFHSSYLTLG